MRPDENVIKRINRRGVTCGVFMLLAYPLACPVWAAETAPNGAATGASSPSETKANAPAITPARSMKISCDGTVITLPLAPLVTNGGKVTLPGANTGAENTGAHKSQKKPLQVTAKQDEATVMRLKTDKFQSTNTGFLMSGSVVCEFVQDGITLTADRIFSPKPASEVAMNADGGTRKKFNWEPPSQKAAQKEQQKEPRLSVMTLSGHVIIKIRQGDGTTRELTGNKAVVEIGE